MGIIQLLNDGMELTMPPTPKSKEEVTLATLIPQREEPVDNMALLQIGRKEK